jgi:hypothetical protein
MVKHASMLTAGTIVTPVSADVVVADVVVAGGRGRDARPVAHDRPGYEPAVAYAIGFRPIAYKIVA